MGLSKVASLCLGLALTSLSALPLAAAELAKRPCSVAGAGASACGSRASAHQGQPSDTALNKAKVDIPNNFHDVIFYAIGVNPQIAFTRGQLAEALAGVDIAEAGKGFQLDASIGAGVGAQGTSTNSLDVTLLQSPNYSQATRRLVTVSGRKLLYDFGSTDLTIDRAHVVTEAQRFALHAKVNDIGFAIADAYIQVFQARELVKLNSENITALEHIQELVQATATNGNGTLADVKRVEARLVDARAVAADTEADLQNAIDAFRRLVKSDPGDLQEAPDLSAYIPDGIDFSLSILRQTSSHLKSLNLAVRAAEFELEAKKASTKPSVQFQTDTTLKSYLDTPWSNLDSQAIVSLSYKFMDGGLAQGQIQQLLARIDEQQQQYDNDRDQAEADLRKYYTTIESARSKTQSLQEGVDASEKARDLYTDQFSAGKRTLFELLDIQTSYFNAKRSAILNMFEERRAVYGVLQALGILVPSVDGVKDPLIADKETKAKSNGGSGAAATTKPSATPSAAAKAQKPMKKSDVSVPLPPSRVMGDGATASAPLSLPAALPPIPEQPPAPARLSQSSAPTTVVAQSGGGSGLIIPSLPAASLPK